MPRSRVPVGPSSLIVEIARLIRRDFGQRAELLNLTQSQWRALYQISHRPGINQAKLAEKLEVHPVSVTHRRLCPPARRNGPDFHRNPRDRAGRAG